MSTSEIIGYFWIVFAATCFTAEVLMAAAWAMLLGYHMAKERYERGKIEEEIAIQEQTELRRMKATGR